MCERKKRQPAYGNSRHMSISVPCRLLNSSISKIVSSVNAIKLSSQMSTPSPTIAA